MKLGTEVSNVNEAVVAAQTGTIEDLLEARTYAERLGAAALHTLAPEVPPEFAALPVLKEGFFAGYEDARCGAACVSAGLA